MVLFASQSEAQIQKNPYVYEKTPEPQAEADSQDAEKHSATMPPIGENPMVDKLRLFMYVNLVMKLSESDQLLENPDFVAREMAADDGNASSWQTIIDGTRLLLMRGGIVAAAAELRESEDYKLANLLVYKFPDRMMEVADFCQAVDQAASKYRNPPLRRLTSQAMSLTRELVGTKSQPSESVQDARILLSLQFLEMVLELGDPKHFARMIAARPKLRESTRSFREALEVIEERGGNEAVAEHFQSLGMEDIGAYLAGEFPSELAGFRDFMNAAGSCLSGDLAELVEIEIEDREQEEKPVDMIAPGALASQWTDKTTAENRPWECKLATAHLGYLTSIDNSTSQRFRQVLDRIKSKSGYPDEKIASLTLESHRAVRQIDTSIPLLDWMEKCWETYKVSAKGGLNYEEVLDLAVDAVRKETRNRFSD